VNGVATTLGKLPVGAIWVEDPTKAGSFRRTELQPYPGGDGQVRWGLTSVVSDC
jgi:hypothetical protein